MKRLKLIIYVIFAMAFAKANAATIEVGPGNNTIQSVIEAAQDGDVIQLQRGKYKGYISPKGKAITIRGVGKNTIVTSGGVIPTIIINDGEKSDTIIEDLRISGGFRAGGILVENASPIIRRCWIINNRALGSGSGVTVFGEDDEGNSATFVNNIIALNKTRSARPGNQSYAFSVVNSNPNIMNNTFYRNDQAAVYLTGSSDPVIQNNIIAYQTRFRGRKKGRGIEVYNLSTSSTADISNNLFFRNDTGDIAMDGNLVRDIEDFSGPTAVTVTSNFKGNPVFIKRKNLRNLSPRAAEDASFVGNFNFGATFGDTPIQF